MAKLSLLNNFILFHNLVFPSTYSSASRLFTYVRWKKKTDTFSNDENFLPNDFDLLFEKNFSFPYFFLFQNIKLNKIEEKQL